MAKLGGVVSGWTPAEPPKPKKKPKLVAKTGRTILHCANCGHEEQNTVYKARKWFRVDDVEYCQGCTQFFGLAGTASIGGVDINTAYTPDSIEAVKEKIERAKETQYVLIKNTQRFGGVKTGMDIEVEFGDIFRVMRAGSDNPTELGTTKAAFAASTIDIQFGPEVLTLYTHEVIPIDWLDVMGLRKDGIVIEQFLSKECQGYFAPTEAGRELLTNMFGHR